MSINNLKYYDFSTNGRIEEVTGNSSLSFTPFSSDEKSPNQTQTQTKEHFARMDDSVPSEDSLLKIKSNLSDYSTEIKTPNQYGYVATLTETRNNDEIDIINNEMSIMALGSIAGIALITLGMIVMYPTSS
jgi:hypothetical protein